MFHKGSRMSSSNLPDDLNTKINVLLDEFLEITNSEVLTRRLRSAIVRSMLPCSIVVILDAATMWIAAQKQGGMPSTNALDHRQQQFPSEEIFTAAKWEFGFDDPFVIAFPSTLLEQSEQVKIVVA